MCFIKSYVIHKNKWDKHARSLPICGHFYFGDLTNGKADFDQYVILCMRNEISKRRKGFLHNRSLTQIYGGSIEIEKKFLCRNRHNRGICADSPLQQDIGLISLLMIITSPQINKARPFLFARSKQQWLCVNVGQWALKPQRPWLVLWRH